MKPGGAPLASRRSAIRFALAVIAAVAMLAVAEWALEIRGYDPDRAVAQASGARVPQTRCTAADDGAVPCAVPAAEH